MQSAAIVFFERRDVPFVVGTSPCLLAGMHNAAHGELDHRRVPSHVREEQHALKASASVVANAMRWGGSRVVSVAPKQIVWRPCAVFIAAMKDDGHHIAGIQCRGCGRRALMPLHRGPGEINGSQLPLTSQRCGSCGSTTLAWRRFVTLAEGDAWAAESVG